MTGRRAAPPPSPARYANLTPSRSETKALPTTPQQSRPPPTFPDPRNAPPPPGRRTTTYLKAKALAALPFQSSNMAGRGAHQIPSPNYAASVTSFDSGSTAVSNSSYPFPRQVSEKFGDGMDLDERELLMGGYRDREDDDDLHAPSARDIESGRPTLFTARGFANLGFLIFILLGIVFLFAGYPIWMHYRNELRLSNLGASGLGGTNASGQVPELSSRFALIDPDTPQSAFFHTSLETQAQWDLVFSDEFNVENRTFYPGDDPYWEAVDLHYYETDDLEYYDPSAIITQGGFLQITLSQQQNHGLDYMSGMLQSWNKFCFTGGYVEVSVSIPGLPSVSGLWPAVWTMGNLGRAGYGSTTDGTWPYSYDSCDVGTLANQTLNGSPPTALLGPNASPLSFLPGQRLSACTCPGEHHPGPVNSDGTFKGRSAPEIDVFEAIINVNGANSFGQVSQSAQTAPFDQAYTWNETQGTILTPSLGDFNNFKGAVFQESVSGLFETNQAAYSGLAAAGSAPTFATYGFEYKPGLDGYITWVNDGTPSWSVGAAATGANTITNISARPIPQEPMYLLANLAISPTFGEISASLTFPAVMYIDYVRVYQDPNAKNIGCSPKDFPTEDYINSLPDLYGDYNLTTFIQAGQTPPKNRLIDTC